MKKLFMLPVLFLLFLTAFAMLGSHDNVETVNAAKIIVIEVVSDKPTILAGPIEIYGEKADLIIANPNGIVCNGCAFVNVGRVSLITGSSDKDTGIFTISAGELEVNGFHSDSRADFVSQSIKTTGMVRAGGDLFIYAHSGKYDYTQGLIISSNN
jgi:filamentous hemagglutinin